MANRAKTIDNKTRNQLPAEWQEQAHKEAIRIPMPADQQADTAEQSEQNLRWAEQEGGE